jgi:hypothetical protein
MGIEMDADKEAKENCVPVMRPILALRNSKPYNCLEVYEKVGFYRKISIRVI